MSINLTLFITHSLLAIVSLFFGTLIYFHGRESVTNRLFAFVSLGITVWSVGNFISFQENSRWVALGVGILFAAVSIQTLFLTIFMYIFPSSEFKIKNVWIKYALWLGGILYIIIGFLVSDTTKLPESFVYQGRVFFLAQLRTFNYIFLPLSFIFVIIPAVIAFRKYRRAEGETRKQLKVIFFTIIIAFLILPFVLAIPIQIFHNPTPNIWGPLVYLPFILAVSYATLRRHLFNVKAIVAEILIFIIWISLLARIFFDDNIQDRLINGTLFIFTIIVGIFLIRSVLNEVLQKERLAELNIQLDDFNKNLRQKVAEQTIEIRQAYEVEKIARLELEELDKAKDQFILTTQHHLRTPLTIVKGYLQSVLGAKGEPLSETTKTSLAKAEEATERIATLVNEFLDISQMEVGKSIFDKKPINIKGILESVIKELEPEAQKKNLKITLTMDNNAILNIDSNKIKEAITSLIDNAVRYNKVDGTITIQGVQTTHPIERDKRIFRITIENTGIGITTEELSKLFTQYFQRGKEAEKLYTTGRGIGLTITKNIIQAHGGRIYAESDGRDKGARFIIELPI